MDMKVPVRAEVKYILILPTSRLIHSSKLRKPGTISWKIKRLYILY